jgi:hypothetical protein
MPNQNHDDRSPEPPLTLSPDDVSPRALRIGDDDDDSDSPSEPYGITAVLVGLLLLLAARLFFDEPVHRVFLGVFGALVTFIVLALRHAKLPVLPLTVAAAELGMLYGMPLSVLFPLHLTGRVGVLLVGYLALGGIVGLLVGRVFGDDRQARTVIPTAFLATFVMAGVATLLRGLMHAPK